MMTVKTVLHLAQASNGSYCARACKVFGQHEAFNMIHSLTVRYLDCARSYEIEGRYRRLCDYRTLP